MNILKRAKRKCGRIIRRVKKVAGKTNDWKLRKLGFSWDGIDRWNAGIERDFKSENGVSDEEKRAMHKLGYYSWHLAQKGFSKDNLENCISDKDYEFLLPFNSIYGKFVNDAITFRYVVHNDPHMLKYYYQMAVRNDNTLVTPLADLPKGYCQTFDSIFYLLRSKGALLYAPSRRKYERWYILEYKNDKYYCDGKLSSMFQIYELFIRNRNMFYQLMEYPGQHTSIRAFSRGRLNRLRLLVVNEHGNDPFIADARMVWGNQKGINVYTTVNLETGAFEESYTEFISWVGSRTSHPDTGKKFQGSIPNWEMIKKGVAKTALSMREAEYYSVDLLVTPKEYAYLSFNAYPKLPRGHVPGKELQAYLMRKLEYKRSLPKQGLVTVKNLISLRDTVLNKFFCEPGFSRYWATDWTQSVIYDFFHYKGPSIKDKLWCYKRGFLSYRKEQYGLNEENWKNIISDYDYKWLSPINSSFFDLIDDKVTYRYVMEPLKQYAPKYYFHLIKRSGKLCIVPMPDCPEKYTADMEGILALLRDEGKLAFKQSSGAHGDGFFKLSYEDGEYKINNEPVSAKDIEECLSTRSCFYALTEYLVMHEDLRKIYSKTVNTIRVMAINKHGTNPKIMHAYMRIGSASTGLTDNVGYGGIFCKIDKNTGRYYEGEQLKDHVIVPCPVHPDSGTLIEGTVPMWDEVYKAVLSICKALPQLEYLGFDVAVTDQGIKILEVNKHQDLHRSHLYGDEVQNFFKDKIRQKKRSLAK